MFFLLHFLFILTIFCQFPLLSSFAFFLIVAFIISIFSINLCNQREKKEKIEKAVKREYDEKMLTNGMSCSYLIYYHHSMDFCFFLTPSHRSKSDRDEVATKLSHGCVIITSGMKILKMRIFGVSSLHTKWLNQNENKCVLLGRKRR